MTVWRTISDARSHLSIEPGGGGDEGPLDIQSGAILAHSLRPLAAANEGNIIYTTEGGFVTSLIDQGTSGSDLEPITSDKAQFVAEATSNGKPALLFDSDTDANSILLGAASEITVPTSSGITVFVCLKPIVNDVGVFSVCGGGGLNGPRGWNFSVDLRGSPVTYFDLNGLNRVPPADELYGGDYGDAGDLTAAFHVLDAQLAPGVLNAYSNGASLEVFPYGDQSLLVDSVAKFVIGCDDVALPDTSFYNGYFAEVIVYPSLLNTETRAAIRQNIADYYGVTLA